jgi:hypothetical protein
MNSFSPERWAFDITHVLNRALGPDHFPIDVPAVAKEITAQKFPDDPIVRVVGENLPGFDGALLKAPAGKKGWGIFYNTSIRSAGRVNFTLGHEFGHYLLHRLRYPDGIQCGEQDFVRWDSEFGQVEHQANVFAANLLMPLDDYRRQIPPASRPTLDLMAHCADRYRVSLIAATLRWLSYTDKRAILVIGQEGFILWARSSPAALKTGAYFRTSARVIELPATSLAARPSVVAAGTSVIDHEADIWLAEPATEMAVFAEQYDFVISILLLSDTPPPFFPESAT